MSNSKKFNFKELAKEYEGSSEHRLRRGRKPNAAVRQLRQKVDDLWAKAERRAAMEGLLA